MKILLLHQQMLHLTPGNIKNFISAPRRSRPKNNKKKDCTCLLPKQQCHRSIMSLLVLRQALLGPEAQLKCCCTIFIRCCSSPSLLLSRNGGVASCGCSCTAGPTESCQHTREKRKSNTSRGNRRGWGMQKHTLIAGLDRNLDFLGGGCTQ